MASSARDKIPVQGQPVLVTRNGVSYEMALMAVFRAVDDEMPEEFGVVYRYDWPEPENQKPSS